jgi:hypothetical protein
MKPSEVRELSRCLGREFECCGICEHCFAEYICDYNNGKELKSEQKKKYGKRKRTSGYEGSC